jgi:hypothetical protein
MVEWHKQNVISKFLVIGQACIWLPTWARIIRRKLAIIGDKSNIPIRGMNDRIGSSIGSVISWMTVYIGFSGLNPVQEKMIRMKMAMRST